MKKYLYSILLFCFSLFLFSCSDYQKDEYNCFISFSQAKQQAMKDNLPIFAIFTDESEAAGGSKFFLDQILSNKKFTKYSKDKFLLYRMDISQETFSKSAIDENLSKKEMEKNQFYADALEEGCVEMAVLGIEYTPYFAFISPEGFAIREIEYPEDRMDVNIFCDILDYYLQEVDIVKHLVEKIQNAKTDKEKLLAIESLYLTTPVNYRNSLIDLQREAIKLDPNNESGYMGKYIFAVTDEDAAQLYKVQNDVEGAVKLYIDTANNPFVGTEEKLQCYYMAAFILENAGLIGDKRIVEYLQLALEQNPTPDLKAQIQDSIEYFSESINADIK